LRRYFPSLKQYSWVLLVCLVLATGIGYIVAKAQPSAFLANATIIVNAGAPGTNYPGVVTSSGDSISQAADDAAIIPSRSVMSFVEQFDPQLQAHNYGVDDLILDITVAAPSTTTSTLILTGTATKPADAVLLVNDAAKGFQAYMQAQAQQALDGQRQNYQNQYNNFQAQSTQLEKQILTLSSTTDPRYNLYTADRNSVIQSMNTVQTQLLALPPTIKSDVFITQLAELKDVTSSSKGTTIIALAAAVGLLLGLVVMALLIFLDNRLRGEDLVKEKLGLAYLGGLSTDNELKDNPTTASGLAMQQVADICANLRLTNVLAGQWHAPQGAVLLVTSSQIAEGKTTLAAALAATVARAGSSVAVVDGNLRNPSTHLAFGVTPTGFGLSGLLKAAGPENLDSAVQRTNVPGVWLLPAGAEMNDPTLMLAQKLPGILAQLRKKTDVIIIDGPALLSGSDAILLATMADGVALVLDARHDKLPLLQRAKELLTSLAHIPAGVVMNRNPRRKHNRYYASAFVEDIALDTHAPVQKSYSNGHDVGSMPRPETVAHTPASNLSPGSLVSGGRAAAAPMEFPVMQPNPPSPFPAPRRMDMTPPQQ